MYWKYGTTLRLKKPWYIGSNRYGTDVDIVLLKTLKTLGAYVEVVTKTEFLKKQDFLQGRKKLSIKYLQHVFGRDMCFISSKNLYDPRLKEKGFEYLL